MNLNQVKENDFSNLVLTVREGEYVKIGDCFVFVHEVRNNKQVSLHFRAPRDVSIFRQRLLEGKVKNAE